jgi:hypothetical protein
MSRQSRRQIIGRRPELLVVGGSQQDRRDGQDKQDKEVQSAKDANKREFARSLKANTQLLGVGSWLLALSSWSSR